MTITATIQDSQTQQPLAGASIELVSPAGQDYGEGVAADVNGYFTITSPLLDQGAQLLITNVGYKTVMLDPSVIASARNVELDPDPQLLQAAVVTPHKRNYWPALAIGAGGLFLLASTQKKKRRVSGIGGEVTEIAVIGGIGVIGFLVLKPILEKFGLLPSAEQKQTAQAQQTALQQAQQQAAASGQAAATYTADQYQGWANDIYNLATATSGGVPADTQDKIVTDVINVNTLVDLQSLIVAFGQRKANCLIFGIDCTTYDLPSFLKAALDTAHIQKINNFLNDQGINYQF